MPLTGDFQKLSALRSHLAGVGKAFAQVKGELRGEVENQYREDFAQQRSPAGDKWKANKDGHTPILFRTGALANPNVTVSGDSIKVRAVPRYAGVHQAKRPILPAGGDAGVWEKPLERVAEAVVEKFFSTF